jgi:DNA-binding NtrC family response regulator
MNAGDKGEVLIVDDEPNALKVLSSILKAEGYGVLESMDVEGAIRIMSKEYVDAVITDLEMPGKNGIQFFEFIEENYPDIPVIFITAYGTVESAVSAMTRGVLYYFIKPPDYVKLRNVLAGAVKARRMKGEIASFTKHLPGENGMPLIIAKTRQMMKIFRAIESIKDRSCNVLICGETGTGKELIARALHYGSERSEKPFIVVNCAAIPRELMEAELFGYEKGAFTGAISRRLGRFEEVSGGTILLDEIGELDFSLQAKLLRVLQEREVERLGSSNRIPVNFRLLCSTNRDLVKEVVMKNFRQDLFYRINVVRLDIPPLKERSDDIPLLVQQFVKEFCLKEGKMLSVSDEAMEIFMNYQWTGNIRQLRNVIERAVVLSKGERLTSKELPEELLPLKKKGVPAGGTKTLKELETQAVMDVLHECKGNKSKAPGCSGYQEKRFIKGLMSFRAHPLVPSETGFIKKI